MPPLTRRLGTFIVKVARPWAGVVGGVPPALYVAGKC